MLPAGYIWSLTAVAVAVAMAMLWTFRHCSDQTRIQLAKRKILAHLLAFRLFADEPAMIFKSQGQLFLWNLRYLGLMVRPAAVTILPLALLLFHLDAVYGRRPLRAGESAVVTVQLSGTSRMKTDALALRGDGISVETAALRFADAGRVCWRVRAVKGEPGSVELVLPSKSVTKIVQAGPPGGYLSKRRVSAFLPWLCYPGEPSLAEASIDSIDVEYPLAEVNVFGFGVHWLVWFCVVSLIAMLMLRRRMRVTF